MARGCPHGRSITYPYVITHLPHRPAFSSTSTLDPQTGWWDNVTACAVGRNPESTGTFRPEFAPSFSTGNSARVGVIVGVVTACTFLAFVLIAAGIWYLLRRRRQRRQVPGTEDKSESPPVLYLAEQENSRFSATTWTQDKDPDKRLYVRASSCLALSFLEFCELTLFPTNPCHAVVSCPCDVLYRTPRTLAHILILDPYRAALGALRRPHRRKIHPKIPV
jgi:hypothetical protein